MLSDYYPLVFLLPAVLPTQATKPPRHSATRNSASGTQQCSLRLSTAAGRPTPVKCVFRLAAFHLGHSVGSAAAARRASSFTRATQSFLVNSSPWSRAVACHDSIVPSASLSPWLTPIWPVSMAHVAVR